MFNYKFFAVQIWALGTNFLTKTDADIDHYLNTTGDSEEVKQFYGDKNFLAENISN